MPEIKAPWIWVVGILVFALLVGSLARAGVISPLTADTAVFLLCLLPAAWYATAFWMTREQALSWGLAVNAAGWLAAGLSFIASGGLRAFLFIVAGICILAGGAVGFHALRNDPQSPFSDGF